MKIKVNTASPYEVIIEKDLIKKSGDYISAVLPSSKKLFIVSDSNVAPHYLLKLEKALKEQGWETFSFVIEAGEQSKSLESFGIILNKALEAGLTRSDAFIALGGGVVGDLCGFAAASYMRGVKYIQIATTLLAAIDSSVGGKTAINLQKGKNMAGAFHQPSLVLVDTLAFETLPEKEWLCGLGEAVKYAVLCGGEIYEILKNKQDKKEAERLIELCVRHKALVVEADEKENGLRKTLNLGHTIGHAIERLTSFSIHHGIAVALGLMETARIELDRGRLNKDAYDEILSLINNYNLKIGVVYNKEELFKAIKSDKKANSRQIAFVGIKKIGEVYIENIELNELKELL